MMSVAIVTAESPRLKFGGLWRGVYNDQRTSLAGQAGMEFCLGILSLLIYNFFRNSHAQFVLLLLLFIYGIQYGPMHIIMHIVVSM